MTKIIMWLTLTILISCNLYGEVIETVTASSDIICVVIQPPIYDNNNPYPIRNPIDLSLGSWLVDGNSVEAIYRQSAPYDALKNNATGYSGTPITMRHKIYLKLSVPLNNFQKYTITTPYGTHGFEFNDQKTLCESIKLNQVGYNGNSTYRFANFGINLGDGGSVLLSDLPKYKVLKQSDNTVVDSGTIEFFSSDLSLKTSASGEHVYRIDLSNIPIGGPYIISINGFGRSWPFGVGNDYSRLLASTHARGMYHQRCGIALEQPYTEFTREICHTELDYSTKTPWTQSTWITDATKAKMEDVCGGYHDAADFDRRPFQTIIPILMLSYFEAFPSHFIDKQYRIPESGNGVPDFLDEALWGVKIWEYLQEDDGSIMAGTETSRHPTYAEVNAATDELLYGTFETIDKVTLSGAGIFAQASRLIRPYDSQRADSLLDRAKLAWSNITDQNITEPTSKLMYASLQLYLATAVGDETLDQNNLYHIKFKEAATLIFFQGQWPEQYLPGNIAANVQTSHFISYLLTQFNKDETLANQMQTAIITGADNGGYMEFEISKFPYPQGFTKYQGWGASTAQGRYADVYCFAWLLSDDSQKKKEYYNTISSLSDYSLGQNPLGQSFVTGLGSVQPQSPLHSDSYYTKYGKGEHDGNPIGNVPGIVLYGATEGRSKTDYQLAFSDKIYPEWNDISPQRRWCDGWAFVNCNEFTTWETMVWNTCMHGFLYDASTDNPAISSSNDAVVISGLGDNTNYGDRAEISSGSVDVSSFYYTRLYLQFELPVFNKHTHIAKAELRGFYESESDVNNDELHAIYESSDDWDERSIMWNNQPGVQGEPLAYFDPEISTVGSDIKWDITQFADKEYKNDGVMSLCFKELNEYYSRLRNAAKYFSSKENPTNPGFRLFITIEPDPAYIENISLGNNKVMLSATNLSFSASYGAEYTFDLSDHSWKSITNNFLTNGVLSFDQKTTTNSAVFYRIRGEID